MNSSQTSDSDTKVEEEEEDEVLTPIETDRNFPESFNTTENNENLIQETANDLIESTPINNRSEFTFKRNKHFSYTKNK